MPIPELQIDVKEQLKNERLQQYAARIFQVQMDIAAYEAVNDVERLEIAKKQLESFITAHDAVSVM